MIRQAGPEDLEVVADLVRAYYQFDGIAYDEARVRPALEQLLRDEGLGFVQLAELDGAVVGHATGAWCFDAEFGGRYLMLTDLFVREGNRGAGLGRALLAAVEEAAKAGGAKAIEGQVLRGNERARLFYLSWGFSFPDRLLMTFRL